MEPDRSVAGDASLKARALDNQEAEAAIAVRRLNRFTAIGMPEGIRIA